MCACVCARARVRVSQCVCVSVSVCVYRYIYTVQPRMNAVITVGPRYLSFVFMRPNLASPPPPPSAPCSSLYAYRVCSSPARARKRIFKKGNPPSDVFHPLDIKIISSLISLKRVLQSFKKGKPLSHIYSSPLDTISSSLSSSSDCLLYKYLGLKQAGGCVRDRARPGQ